MPSHEVNLGLPNLDGLSEAHQKELDKVRTIEGPLIAILGQAEMQRLILGQEIGLVIGDSGSGVCVADAFQRAVQLSYDQHIGGFQIPRFDLLGRKPPEEIDMMRDEFEGEVAARRIDPTFRTAIWVTDFLNTFKTAENAVKLFKEKGMQVVIVSHSASPDGASRVSVNDVPSILEDVPMFHGKVAEHADDLPAFAQNALLNRVRTHSGGVEDGQKLQRPVPELSLLGHHAQKLAYEIGYAAFTKVLQPSARRSIFAAL